VRDTIMLGHKLANKKIYLACDKGNKKGIGHFVKVLSHWEVPRRSKYSKVDFQILDIDAAGGTSSDCADGIESSMSRLKFNKTDDTHLLHGQNTDSGGGGTLDGLADELHKCPHTTIGREKYLVSNCTIHAVQTQLRNAIVNVLGEGALERVNAMQLLHSVYRLQESIDLAEWRHVLIKASEFVAEYDPTLINEDPDLSTRQNEHRQEFYSKHNMILKYHTGFKKTVVNQDANYEGGILAKITAPILTRWWTVGAGASYVFDYYLQLFHACQTIINMYSSGTTPYLIASDLFALMYNQENFVDMTLIRSFHKAYISPHLDWLQKSEDLTSALGFQSHHIAVRYFVMEKNIEHILSRNPMTLYLTAVQNWITSNDSNTKENEERLMKKQRLFVHEASDSLHKHFIRWLSSSLLPAALMSEPPIAKMIACIILDVEPQYDVEAHPMSGWRYFNSLVHNNPIELRLFHKFVKDRIGSIPNNGDYTPEAIKAAQLVLQGVDMR